MQKSIPGGTSTTIRLPTAGRPRIGLREPPQVLGVITTPEIEEQMNSLRKQMKLLQQQLSVLLLLSQ
jgi:hypothetical protein